MPPGAVTAFARIYRAMPVLLPVHIARSAPSESRPVDVGVLIFAVALVAARMLAIRRSVERGGRRLGIGFDTLRVLVVSVTSLPAAD